MLGDFASSHARATAVGAIELAAATRQSGLRDCLIFSQSSRFEPWILRAVINRQTFLFHIENAPEYPAAER